MPIIVTCQCGRQLQARDALAGRRAKCPGCGALLVVEPPIATAAAAAAAEAVPAVPAVPAAPALDGGRATRGVAAAGAPATLAYAGTTTPDTPEPLVYGAAHPIPVIARAPEEVERLEQSWRGNLFWLLLLAMIPLAWLALVPNASVEDRVRRTLEAHPDVAGKFGFSPDMSQAQFEAMLEKLPGQRIHGALLGRHSVWPLVMALLSTLLFVGLIRLALPTSVTYAEILLTGAFTGTLGVMLLLGAQLGGAFCCIGAFYLAAFDPEAPFGPSLIGFVFGIGFLEETVKCLPVLLKLFRRQLLSWRASAVIGMASGAGFGISEGILYATRYYNGLEGADMYFVRFCSTVALHVMLSAACAIMIQRKQDYLMEEMDFINWTLTLMAVIFVPIFLHGLYNALAKQHLQLASLAVSLGSFAWMAWLIRSSRGREKTIATAAAAMPQFVRTAKGTRFVAPPAPPTPPPLPPRRAR